MDKEELEKEVYIKYGVAPMQVYKDNDKRESNRRIKVLGVALKPDKASCSACDIHGKCYGRTVWIKFERLNSKAYTRILTKHWINPWKNAIPVPIEELAECHMAINQLCGSSNGSFILTKEKILEHWREAGYMLDAYILPQPSGYHSIGIRYGSKAEEYLSPGADVDKVQALLDKYKSLTDR